MKMEKKWLVKAQETSLLNLVGLKSGAVYGDHQRCVDTYYSMYPGYYTTEMVPEEMLTDIID